MTVLHVHFYRKAAGERNVFKYTHTHTHTHIALGEVPGKGAIEPTLQGYNL
jgi:hypothetical protein